MQDSPSETSAGISTPARHRTRQSLDCGAAAVSLEDPNDGDKEENSEIVDVKGFFSPISSKLLTAPLVSVPETQNSPKDAVRTVKTPAAKTNLQAVEREMHQISGTASLGMLTRRPSGRRWRAHAPDYDEELARAHLFKPPLPPTHTDKRRVAIYYTCEKIALFKLLNWMDKIAKESRRAEATEVRNDGRLQTDPGLAKWKNKMHHEVLHSSFTPEQTVDTTETNVGDKFVAQRAAALQEKHAFYFATGCCVFWGLTREEEAWRLMMLTPFSSGIMDQVDAQDMEFSYGDRSSIAKDAINLCTMSVAEKMALSFAMSQSATLGAFEMRVDDRIRSTKHIPSRLASVGSIQYSQEDMSKLIGHLFIELADVNIHSNILDEPEYFFKSQDNDDFKYLYEKMLKYQDVANRVAILNKRLSIIRDLVGVLNQQLTHHQGIKLEWIVIWMLVFQVIIAIGWEIILKDILGYFYWG